MAGEAVLSSMMQMMFDKAFTAAAQEISLVVGVKKELTRLAATLRTIRSVLDDAEERQTKDAAVRDWLRRLRGVCYVAEDVLDGYAAEALRRKMDGFRFGDLLLPPCFCSTRTSLNCTTAHRIRAVRRELDEIARERDSLRLREFGGVHRLEITERSPTSSLVDDSSVFGRRGDTEKVVKLLISESDSVDIVTILGMGGLGKTTLAQLLYNDRRVEERFQLRTWVCVSENFDIGKITKEIAEAVTEVDREGGSTRNGTTAFTTTTFTNLNLVQESIMVKLRTRRFLVVLDDVWSDDLDKWQTLLSPLKCGARGSKVLVTTRSERVAKAVGSRHMHRLMGLGDEDCWQLFNRWAFVDADSSGYPKLEEIGKEIVKKLKGFPLAAKTIGSLLYSKVDENDWYNILRSEIWELPPDKNSILPALRLSYQHLPPHLKRCFVYCSVFHKDYVFVKEDLIKIWMAQGYVQPQGRKRMEDIAGEYFDDLVCMSFFQHHGENYVMHDMVHDLAQLISVEECFRIEDDNKCYSPKTIRHLSFSSVNSVPTRFEDFYSFKRLHTLMLLRGYKSQISEVPHDLFAKLRCLRVLVLQRRNIKSLPSSIGNLHQLRYLNLTGCSVQSLPLSTCGLYNLQTLKLQNCVLLDSLPKDMNRLINLRHLEATSALISTINGIGKLTHLQALEEYVVLDKRGHRIVELKDMSELRGKLSIKNLENVEDNAEAREAKISEKTYVSILELSWAESNKVPSRSHDLADKILEGLQPHSNLKELKIRCYGGLKFPSWAGSRLLSNLQNLSLSQCRQCESLPCLGQLPFLKSLLIEGMDAIKQISSEFYGEREIRRFPSLEELAVLDMPNLNEWHEQPEGMSFPILREFQIEDCYQLGSLPLLPTNLTRLRISEAGIISLPGLRRCSDDVEKSQNWPLASSVISSSGCLSSLHISNCPKLTSLTEGLLTYQLFSLEDLTIGNCENLLFLPPRGFEDFVSLKTLHIYNCVKLKFCSNETVLPSSLQDLRIRSSSNIVKTLLLSELKNLNSLKHVEFADCPNIISFPKMMPANLEFLRVSNCADLQFLPSELQRLSSLRTLIISNCPQMEYLPQGGLPKLLKELFINKCPSLKSKYGEEGIYRHAIAHVPNIDFDEENLFHKMARQRQR